MHIPSPCRECRDSMQPHGTACRECYIYHYLLPHLANELRKIKIEIAPIIRTPGGPGPDPGPLAIAAQLEGELVRAFAGEPIPNVDLIDTASRLKATIAMRKSLSNTIAVLDKQIHTLQEEK